jgi:hypothetical protein
MVDPDRNVSRERTTTRADLGVVGVVVLPIERNVGMLCRHVPPRGHVYCTGTRRPCVKPPMPEEERAGAMVMVMVMTDMNFLVISRGV